MQDRIIIFVIVMQGKSIGTPSRTSTAAAVGLRMETINAQDGRLGA